jgi:hypothetical protein
VNPTSRQPRKYLPAAPSPFGSTVKVNQFGVLHGVRRRGERQSSPTVWEKEGGITDGLRPRVFLRRLNGFNIKVRTQSSNTCQSQPRLLRQSQKQAKMMSAQQSDYQAGLRTPRDVGLLSGPPSKRAPTGATTTCTLPPSLRPPLPLATRLASWSPSSPDRHASAGCSSRPSDTATWFPPHAARTDTRTSGPANGALFRVLLYTL